MAGCFFKLNEYCILNELRMRKINPLIAEDRATVCVAELQTRFRYMGYLKIILTA